MADAKPERILTGAEEGISRQPISADDAEEFTQAVGQVFGGGWRLILYAQKQGIPEALGMTTEDWVSDRLGGYVRHSIEERREAVGELTDGEGLSNVEAAAVLGVSEGTIRADKKAASQNYEPEDSQQIEDASDQSQDYVAAQSEPPSPPETPPMPEGEYRCIVIDPPWPMEKIEREVRPKQGQHLDYHVWSMQEIRDRVGEYLGEKAERSGCHVYLWVTHRHLPEALRMFDAWGVRYQCLMTWRKNVGITPYSWMYDTEHVLFGRIGGLQVQQKGLRLWFDAPVKRHSEKPDIFYERVRAASPEPRLDLFAREFREGFTVWGNEVAAG